MKVSIVTPSWNSEATILRTLESIQNQSYPAIEWIIVDNSSTDNTLKLIRDNFKESEERQLIIIREPDKGISDAFNKGVTRATGEVVAILNSDDAYCKGDIVEKVMENFQEDPELSFIHGDMVFEDLDFGTNQRAPLLCSVDYAMPYNHPTMFLRKDLYNRIGLFKEEYKLAMDFELVLRMYESSEKCLEKSKYLSIPLVYMYAGGMSDVQEMKSIDEVEKALKEHGFWSAKAWRNLTLRRLRIRIKGVLKKLGLSSLIALWRNYKWR